MIILLLSIIIDVITKNWWIIIY